MDYTITLPSNFEKILKELDAAPRKVKGNILREAISLYDRTKEDYKEKNQNSAPKSL